MTISRRTSILVIVVIAVLAIAVIIEYSAGTFDFSKDDERDVQCCEDITSDYGIFIDCFIVSEYIKVVYDGENVGKLTWNTREIDGLDMRIIDVDIGYGSPLVSIIEINGKRVYTRKINEEMIPRYGYTIYRDGNEVRGAEPITRELVDNGSIFNYNNQWYIIYDEYEDEWVVDKLIVENDIDVTRWFRSEYWNMRTWGLCIDNGTKITWNIIRKNGGYIGIYIDVGENEHYNYYIWSDMIQKFEHQGFYNIYFIQESREICIRYQGARSSEYKEILRLIPNYIKKEVIE